MTMGWRIRGSVGGGDERFISSPAVSYSLGTGDQSGWGVKLTTHLHRVPRNEWSYTSALPIRIQCTCDSCRLSGRCSVWRPSFCLPFVLVGCWARGQLSLQPVSTADVERCVLLRTCQRSAENFVACTSPSRRWPSLAKNGNPPTSPSYCGVFKLRRFEHASSRLAHFAACVASWMRVSGNILPRDDIIQTVRCTIPGRRTSVSKTSGPALGPTRPPVQWVLGFLPGTTAAGAWSWPGAEVKNERSCKLPWRGQEQLDSLQIFLCTMAVTYLSCHSSRHR